MPRLLKTIENWSKLSPQHPCIIEAETGQSISYQQCLQAIYALHDAFGDSPRCIAMMLPGGIATALTWLSALTGGHTLVPLSPDATDSEKAALTRRYRPDLLIVEERADAQGFDHPTATVLTRHQIMASVGAGSPRPCVGKPDASGAWADAGAVNRSLPTGRVCLHTSGSTGEPKGVLLNEQQIVWAAEHIRASHQLTSQDIGLSVLPFFHVNAPVVSLCTSLLAGSTVVIARRFSRQQFWSWIDRYQITWASIVPTIVAILLGTEKPAFLPGPLRFVRTASAPLPVVHLRSFEEKFGIPVIETYGLSEAASQVTANPVPPGTHKPGSVGQPTGVELRICQPVTISERQQGQQGQQDLRAMESGEVGEICVRGPSVIAAYQGNASRQSFQDGWFRTGDLGYQDADCYVYITGRLREVINRGGENIAPREIEEVLLSHAGVHEAAVVGRPDPLYGEVVVAYVVMQLEPEYAGSRVAVATRTVNTLVTQTAIKQELQQFAAHHLSHPKVPVDIIVVEQLPRTASGKIARQVLREQEQQRG